MIEMLILGTPCIAMNCGTCGVVFAMPSVAYETARREGGFFTCSNGHSRGWDKSASQNEAERQARETVRLERDRLRQALAQKDDEIKAVAAERDAARKQSLRTITRANNGVCQDCNRTFSNLLRHRESKHGMKCEVVSLPSKRA